MITETIKKEGAKIKTVKISAATHEQLRILAFKKNIKIKALIEMIIKEYVAQN